MDGSGVGKLSETRAPLLVRNRPENRRGPPALQVAGVSYSYGERRALDNVSFAVAAGGFTALLGLNGAGKTTLLSLITRLFDTRHGRIAVQGFDIARKPSDALARLGVVFQARTLDLELTVRDNLLYHASLHGMRSRLARARVQEVLAGVGLLDRARERARLLSGGQMRRIEIARALVHRPTVLVLDEPTVGLDVASKSSIIEHVRGLSRTEGVAVLWTTHLLDEVEAGDEVVVLHKGRVLAEGSREHIIATAGAADLRSAFRTITGTAPVLADAAAEGEA